MKVVLVTVGMVKCDARDGSRNVLLPVVDTVDALDTARKNDELLLLMVRLPVPTNGTIGNIPLTTRALAVVAGRSDFSGTVMARIMLECPDTNLVCFEVDVEWSKSEPEEGALLASGRTAADAFGVIKSTAIRAPPTDVDQPPNSCIMWMNKEEMRNRACWNISREMRKKTDVTHP